jgi:hypothetical protein
MASGPTTSSGNPDQSGDDWYYADHIGEVGPLDLQDLKGRLATIPNADRILVRRAGTTAWQRAGEVREFFPSQPVRPPAAPIAGTSAPRRQMSRAAIVIGLGAGVLIAVALWAALR